MGTFLGRPLACRAPLLRTASCEPKWNMQKGLAPQVVAGYFVAAVVR